MGVIRPTGQDTYVCAQSSLLLLKSWPHLSPSSVCMASAPTCLLITARRAWNHAAGTFYYLLESSLV